MKDDDVVCSRNENGVVTNIKHSIKRHSPDGFEWGYGGSGPSEFALNILAAYVTREQAERWYQDFKFEVIAALPHEGGTIKKEDILKWVEGKEAGAQ